MTSPQVTEVSVTRGSDQVRIALYRLELAILPHVQSGHELRRRLRRLEVLRSGLRVQDQMALVREFDAVALPECEF